MGYYATALFGIAAVAEVVGLGGIPRKAVETENVLFIVLLIIFIVTILIKFYRR